MWYWNAVISLLLSDIFTVLLTSVLLGTLCNCEFSRYLASILLSATWKQKWQPEGTDELFWRMACVHHYFCLSCKALWCCWMQNASWTALYQWISRAHTDQNQAGIQENFKRSLWVYTQQEWLAVVSSIPLFEFD